MSPEGMVIEKLLRVVDKQQEEVDFVLNYTQQQIDKNITGRDIYPKARQPGVSMYFLARNFIKCLGVKNTRAAIISHDTLSTRKLLERVNFFIDTIKCPKPLTDTHNRNEISFPKTNSAIYIGTAGAKKFGRGDFITDLHCSEIAYWPDPKSLAAGLFQAVPRTGRISVESTGNGAGDYYHSICMRAARGNGRFKLHFIPWYTIPEYSLPVSESLSRDVMESLDEDFEEPQLVRQYNLTAGQILWRRDKLEEMEYDLRLLKQEYPTTLDNCFQAMGSGIFYKIYYEETSAWQRRDTYLWALDGHPMKGRSYVIGCDVSGGVYRDSSVMEVFDCETMEQVGEWISNKTSPDIFAVHIAKVGKLFNEAYVSVESNNHGIVTLSELKAAYPSSLIHRLPRMNPQHKGDEVQRLVDLGSRVTQKTKPYLIGKLRKGLAGGAVIHSPVLKSELNTFVEFEDGSMGAQQGSYDDCVMAAAHAHYVRERAAMIDRTIPIWNNPMPVDAFTLDGIIEEMTKSRQKTYDEGWYESSYYF